jgi:hypothetical protein
MKNSHFEIVKMSFWSLAYIIFRDTNNYYAQQSYDTPAVAPTAY